MFRTCSWSDRVSGLPRELQMISGPSVSKHHAVETVVIFELADDGEAKSTPVELDHGIQITARSSDSQVGCRNSAKWAGHVKMPNSGYVSRRASLIPIQWTPLPVGIDQTTDPNVVTALLW